MFRTTYRLWYWTMLSKDYRLRVTEIACRIKLGRTVSLDERKDLIVKALFSIPQKYLNFQM